MKIREEIDKAWKGALSPLFAELGTEILVQTVVLQATQQDPLYGEPESETVFSDPVSLRARVKLEKERLVLPGGEEVEIDGRVTIRTGEAGDKGITPGVGMRVILEGQRYTVVQVELRGQVGDEFLLTRLALRRED